MNINQEAIKNQVNSRISHEFTTILPRLRGLRSLMMQAPLDNTEDMQEFNRMLMDFQHLMPSSSSAPGTVLARLKAAENISSSQHFKTIPINSRKHLLPPSPEQRQKRHNSNGFF